MSILKKQTKEQLEKELRRLAEIENQYKEIGKEVYSLWCNPCLKFKATTIALIMPKYELAITKLQAREGKHGNSR